MRSPGLPRCALRVLLVVSVLAGAGMAQEMEQVEDSDEPAAPPPVSAPTQMLLRSLPKLFGGTLFVDLATVREDLPQALEASSVRCQLEPLERLGLPILGGGVDRLGINFRRGGGGFDACVGVAEGAGVPAAGEDPAVPREGPDGRLWVRSLGPGRVLFSYTGPGGEDPLASHTGYGIGATEVFPDLGRSDAYLQIRLEFAGPPPATTPAPTDKPDLRGLIYIERQEYDLVRDGVHVAGALRTIPTFGPFKAFGIAAFGLKVASEKAKEVMAARREELPAGPAKDLLAEIEVLPSQDAVLARFRLSRGRFAASAEELVPFITATRSCTGSRPPAPAQPSNLDALPASPTFSSWLW